MAANEDPVRGGRPFLTSCAVGAFLWIALVAEIAPEGAERHPDGADDVLPLYFLLAFVLAPAVLGFRYPGVADVIGAGLAAPVFVLAPWTTSSGGWVFIFVYLLFVVVVAAAVAYGSAKVAGLVRGRRPPGGV